MWALRATGDRGGVGGGLWPGHHHGARVEVPPSASPTVGLPWRPAPARGQAPERGRGGRAEGSGEVVAAGGGRRGVGGAPQAPKFLWSVHKIFFGDLCGSCVGYARASRGLAGSPLAAEGLRGVAGSSSRAAVERASKAMGSRTLDFRGRCLGWLAFRERRLGRTRTGQTPEGALARRPLLIGKNPNPRKGRGG